MYLFCTVPIGNGYDAVLDPWPVCRPIASRRRAGQTVGAWLRGGLGLRSLPSSLRPRDQLLRPVLAGASHPCGGRGGRAQLRGVPCEKHPREVIQSHLLKRHERLFPFSFVWLPNFFISILPWCLDWTVYLWINEITIDYSAFRW